MGLTYHFDSDVAIATGNINDAVILESIRFWTLKNKENGKNFHDGRYFTYNSTEAWAKLYKFWSARQIRTILDRLEKNGWIVTGCYNAMPFDRTKWYALSDKAIELFDDYKVADIRQNEDVPLDTSDSSHLTHQSNQICHISQTNTSYIQDEQTDILYKASDTKCQMAEEKPKKKKGKAGDMSDEDIVNFTNQISENPEVRKWLREWVADRKARRLPLTLQALKINLNKLKDYDDHVVINAIMMTIERGYRGIFINDNIPKKGANKYERNNTIQPSFAGVPQTAGNGDGFYTEAANRKTEQFLREHPELFCDNA